MATKIFIHREKGFEIKVQARKGKLQVTKNGFVQISTKYGFYKGCNAITPEALHEDFREA
ncbi:MAG: hypothetical protein ABXS91_10835 [Sulfurimonas sp.]